MHLEDLRGALAALGARQQHADRVLRRWLQGQAPGGGRRRDEDFLPRAVREAEPELRARWSGRVRLLERHPSGDGAERLLLGLADAQTIEAVLLPGQGLCVSTQVGCAVGCVFCSTGQGGLQRQLGSAEILAQVVLARGLRPVRKVVCMGMGEPAHNLDAVVEALQALGTLGGFAHKELVFSTVGDERVFERLAAGPVYPALALSLHTVFADKRARLLPRAPRIDLAELVERGEQYARRTHHPIQYQWTLIEGVNDGPDEVEGLVALLQGRYAMLNLIPMNPVPGSSLRRPTTQAASQMAARLQEGGVLTKLRDSAAQQVEGGCGQLRARRQFLQGMLGAVPVALPGLLPVAARAQSAPAKKFEKSAVSYQETPAANGDRCESCIRFDAPASCQVVEGEVRPEAWCKLYEAGI